MDLNNFQTEFGKNICSDISNYVPKVSMSALRSVHTGQACND